MVKRSTLDRTMRECMDVRILLAKRYQRGTFRVVHHVDVLKEELPRVAKKKSHSIQRLSINYNSRHISHEDLMRYLGESGYGNFVPSTSNDGITNDEDYDSRLVGFVYPEAHSLSKFT